MLSRSVSTHLRELPLVLLHQRRVDLDLGRRESRGRDELKRRVAEMKCKRKPNKN